MPASKIRGVRPEPSNLRAFEPSNAFTLIEVLVATAIMAIIVLMLGGVFNQAASSWDSGYARAEEGMAVRAVIGSLTRDLATAVDGRRYGLDKPISTTGGLTFYRLTGDDDGGVEKVTYSGGSTVSRNNKPIYSGTNSDGQGANFEFYVSDPSEQTEDSDLYRPYESDAFWNGITWKVPYVKVRCTLTRKGRLSGIEVRSLGKDGKKSDDDIVVK